MTHKIVLYENRTDATKAALGAEIRHMKRRYSLNRNMDRIHYIPSNEINPGDSRDLDNLNRFQVRLYPDELVEIVKDKGYAFCVISSRELPRYATETGMKMFHDWAKKYNLPV